MIQIAAIVKNLLNKICPVDHTVPEIVTPANPTELELLCVSLIEPTTSSPCYAGSGESAPIRTYQ
jgi:hypothetical protein